jgi:hypothetical protein
VRKFISRTENFSVKILNLLVNEANKWCPELRTTELNSKRENHLNTLVERIPRMQLLSGILAYSLTVARWDNYN